MPKLLGQILVKRHALSKGDLMAALAKQPAAGKSLGQLLIALGLITPMDLDVALREQAESRRGK